MADVTPKTYTQILKQGTYAAYNALETKDSNVLYFCTDVGKFFKGNVDFTNSVIVAATRPQTPVLGKIYLIGETDTVEVYVNNAWKVLSYPLLASDTDAEENDISTISAASTDMQVASAKNVYLAIKEAVDSLAASTDVVKNVTASNTAATITKTFGDDSTVDVQIQGVVTAPTWDASSRLLTIPVTGQANPVEVNIGKDIFIDSTAPNGYNKDTGNIDIYLNDGTQSSDPTKISIPAQELMNVYVGDQTSTTNVTIAQVNVADEGEDPVYEYKLRVNVKVSTAQDNMLEVDSVNGGLYVPEIDLTPYVTTTTFSDYQSTVSSQITGLDGRITSNTTAISTLNGNSSTEGSVDYKIANAQSTLQNNIDDVEDKADAAQEDADQNTADIAALAAATTVWGTF